VRGLVLFFIRDITDSPSNQTSYARKTETRLIQTKLLKWVQGSTRMDAVKNKNIRVELSIYMVYYKEGTEII
jgi:hypothetical protein